MLPNDDLSFQLWSAARAADSLEQQLRNLKSFGYTDVQPYHTQYDDPEGMKRLIDEIGLTAKTGHFNVSMFEDEFDRVIAAAKLLGMNLLVAPYIQPADRPIDVAGWQRYGKLLQGHASRCEALGYRFAWHNHEFEFEVLPDGSYPIEHLLGEHLLWEADLAWVLRADVDPEPWLERYTGRIPAVHVKDIAPKQAVVTEGGWADVGAGIVDWPTLWAASVAAGSQLMIAEHDEPDDYARLCAHQCGGDEAPGRSRVMAEVEPVLLAPKAAALSTEVRCRAEPGSPDPQCGLHGNRLPTEAPHARHSAVRGLVVH